MTRAWRSLPVTGAVALVVGGARTGITPGHGESSVVEGMRRVVGEPDVPGTPARGGAFATRAAPGMPQPRVALRAQPEAASAAACCARR